MLRGKKENLANSVTQSWFSMDGLQSDISSGFSIGSSPPWLRLSLRNELVGCIVILLVAFYFYFSANKNVFIAFVMVWKMQNSLSKMNCIFINLASSQTQFFIQVYCPGLEKYMYMHMSPYSFFSLLSLVSFLRTLQSNWHGLNSAHNGCVTVGNTAG